MNEDEVLSRSHISEGHKEEGEQEKSSWMFNFQRPVFDWAWKLIVLCLLVVILVIVIRNRPVNVVSSMASEEKTVAASPPTFDNRFEITVNPTTKEGIPEVYRGTNSPVTISKIPVGPNIPTIKSPTSTELSPSSKSEPLLHVQTSSPTTLQKTGSGLNAGKSGNLQKPETKNSEKAQKENPSIKNSIHKEQKDFLSKGSRNAFSVEPNIASPAAAASFPSWDVTSKNSAKQWVSGNPPAVVPFFRQIPLLPRSYQFYVSEGKFDLGKSGENFSVLLLLREKLTDERTGVLVMTTYKGREALFSRDPFYFESSIELHFTDTEALLGECRYPLWKVTKVFVP